MKRRWLSLLLAGCLLLLTGCGQSTQPIPESTIAPGVDTLLPSPGEAQTMDLHGEATLWFRFLTEPYLAPETRIITQQSGQSYEMALLNALFAGPGTQQPELSGMFPEGTRVLSTVRQGRTLLVTVSAAFLQPLPDQPGDWNSDEAWQIEAPLRRRLAMQSLVATVTENCDVDEVLVLVDQGRRAENSLRLRQSWFLDGSDDSVLTGPQTRDDRLLLSPSVTADALLGCWLQRDWARLYRYVAASDPLTGVSRPSYDDFVQEMEALPPLLRAACGGSAVAANGLIATCTITASIGVRGGQIERGARVFRLHRANGLWKVSFSQLTGWLEGDYGAAQ